MNESLFNRWKNAIEQTKQNNFLLSSSNHLQNDKKKIIQSQVHVDNHQNIKSSVHKQQKNKASRIYSSDSKKNTASRDQKAQQNKKNDTPIKKISKKNDKPLQNCLNAILQLVQISNQDKARNKIRSLLQDLLLNAFPSSQNTETYKFSKLKQSIVFTSQHQRQYCELQNKYFESEKQRHYLKGKSEMITKKFQGLERQLQRYSKMQKLIQSCISREAELKQQISKLRHQKEQLQFKINQQKQIFNRQLNNVHMLIQSLKSYLPSS